LSAFAPTPTADDKIYAGVEVDDICWPTECTELIERARRGFDRFVDHLTERITQDERCIAIAGFCPGDGRTLITLATAKHLATRGIHTLMVDANFENPMLGPSCRITPQSGWCEVVAGQRTLEEALITSRSDGVTLLPCRGRSQTSEPPCDSVQLAATFATLKEQYDLVLLDTTALHSPTAVAQFAGLAEAIRLDAIYLVRDTRTTSVEEMAATCAALRQAHVAVAGIIDNFVAPAELHHRRMHIPLPNFASRLLASRD
jgi:Mrp family chromosome partitioning ATPase